MTRQKPWGCTQWPAVTKGRAGKGRARRRAPGWMATLVAAALALALALAAGGCDRVGAGAYDDHGQSLQRCGEGWVLIPAGHFTMGVDEGDPRFPTSTSFLGISPKRSVQMSDYCIGRTEVSVAEYRRCVAAGACALPDATWEDGASCNYSRAAGEREQHPVNCIGWEKARAYCQWLGGDLPSEAQWEKAARGTDERFYPWGEQTPDCSRANYDENGPYEPDNNSGAGAGCFHSETPSTWEVGHLTSSKGDSPYGLKDMAGNVGEWFLDCFSLYYWAECSAGDCRDPVNLHDHECVHGLRGNASTQAWPENLNAIESGSTFGSSPGTGLRCAKAAQPANQSQPPSELATFAEGRAMP